MLINRNELVKGIRDTKEVFIKELNGELIIRKLSDSEFEEIKRKRKESIKTKVRGIGKEQHTEVMIETDKLMEAVYESNIIAVKYSVVFEPILTKQEILNFPVGAVESIANAIFEFNGLDPDEGLSPEQLKEVEEFRQ